MSQFKNIGKIFILTKQKSNIQNRIKNLNEIKLIDPDYKIKQHEFLDPIARYHAGEHVDGLDNICEKHYNMFLRNSKKTD